MAPVHTLPPEEVLQEPFKNSGEDYVAWRAATDLRAPYRVAPEFLQGTKPDAAYDLDEVPLIVFINARSGGRVGPELANVLARALGRSQVFDVAHHRPDCVLRKIWDNFDEQERMGNPRTRQVRQRLRILACGGDGTVAWILKVIHQMDLQPQPAVAIMPLGTGNDLSRSFKWGALFDWAWIKGHASVYSTLKRIADAHVADLDCWQLRVLLPSAAYKPRHTYAIEEDQAAQRRLDSSAIIQAGSYAVVMQGLFWNYFSVGADAQAAYNFHHLRDQHPMLAPNRVANQFWYSAFSCTSGWFCGALPSVSTFTHIEVLQPGSGTWSALHIPSSIKALVLVNLQSYAGGRNIWGASESKKKMWRKPNVADGLIEVVGFTHGYHAMAIMASNAQLAHGKRLAQVAGIRLALHDPTPQPDGVPGRLFMQLDGEPWMQEVPAGSSTDRVVLEVVHAGVSKVLVNSTEPIIHPVKKMTKLLSEQQQQQYLTAGAAQQDPSQVELQQQQHAAHSDDGSDSAYEPHAAARNCVQELQELTPGRVHACPHTKSSTYGGALPLHIPAVPVCSSCSDPGVAAVAEPAGMGAARRSLQMQPGAAADQLPSGGLNCGDGYRCQVPSAMSSAGPRILVDGQYYQVAPSAVAVIEKVAVPQLLDSPVKPHVYQQGNSGNGTCITAA